MATSSNINQSTEQTNSSIWIKVFNQHGTWQCVAAGNQQLSTWFM
jgi:hypothetical protein